MGNNSSRNASVTTTPRVSSTASRRLLHALGVGTNHHGEITAGEANYSPESHGRDHNSPSPSPLPPPLLEFVDGGQTNSFGKLYPGIPEYDMNIVKNFILDKRLAPFFAPLDDSTAMKSIDESTQGIRDIKLTKEETVISALHEEEPMSSECPICFMTYPPYFNYTKCCDQAICTECFIQIKRPETSFDPASCPYCQTPHFSIIYQPTFAAPITATIIDSPSTQTAPADQVQLVLGSQEEKEVVVPCESPKPDLAIVPSFVSASLSRRQSNYPVLTSDDIRPDWKQKKQKMELNRILEQQRIALATARRRQMEAYSQAELANAAIFAAQIYDESIGRGRGSSMISSFRNSGSRRNDENQAQHVRAMRYLGADVEELMLLEAMRRSMQDTDPTTSPDPNPES